MSTSTRGKWTVGDIPDQSGRVAVVTGANAGIGYETAQALALRGATVVLAVRDTGRGGAAADNIRRAGDEAGVEGVELALQQLDLASLASVREAAAALGESHPAIDLLINNAGVMYTPRSDTADGFELQFGTNHLGHFALTGLLLDRMLPVAGSRVVTVASVAHRIRAAVDVDDLDWTRRRYGRVSAYGQSKLANLLFTYELQRRLAAADEGKAQTIAVAAHPGFTHTELMRNSPAALRAVAKVANPVVAQSARMGALPTLRAATDPAVQGGQYYGPRGPFEYRGHPKLVSSSAQSHDESIQRRLWDVSQDLTGITYPV